MISCSVSTAIGHVANIPVRSVPKIISTIQCRLVPHVGGLQPIVTPGRPGHFELNRRKSFPKPLPAYTRNHKQPTKPFPAEEKLAKEKLTCRGPSPQPLCTEFERVGLSTEEVVAELTRRINPLKPPAVCTCDPISEPTINDPPIQEKQIKPTSRPASSSPSTPTAARSTTAGLATRLPSFRTIFSLRRTNRSYSVLVSSSFSTWPIPDCQPSSLLLSAPPSTPNPQL